VGSSAGSHEPALGRDRYSPLAVKVPRRRGAPRPILRELHRRHPGFRTAVLADVIANQKPGAPRDLPATRLGRIAEVIRLVATTDAFGALMLYRLRAACLRRGVPVVPLVAHRLAVGWAQLSIGDPVLVHPGIRIPHGQIVIDGFVEIHPGAKIRPFVTIGLKEGDLQGPTIEANVAIGTGAKLIGPITIGEGAAIGANAVVVDDVPARAVVAGVPARVVARTS